MKYVPLGSTGLRVSQLCLGTWMFGNDIGKGEVVNEKLAHELLELAYQSGINFIDTANVYGSPISEHVAPHSERRCDPGRSESYIGSWLAGKDREDLVIASKAYFATRGRENVSLSRKQIRCEIEGTLERLGTSYIDIYYHHGWHPATPIEETLSVFNDLVREGKVHYLGLSNFTSWQIVKAREICRYNRWEIPCVTQPRFNAADNVPYTVDPEERALLDLLDLCRYENISLAAYAPLAGGFLAGRYERDSDGNVICPSDSRGGQLDRYGPFPEKWWTVLEELRCVANEVGTSTATTSLAWLLQTPGLNVIPIIGARTSSQIKTALDAFEVELSLEQWERINQAGAPLLGSKAYL